MPRRIDLREVAHVRLVRVARDDEVDPRIELGEDIPQVACHRTAAGVAVARLGHESLVDRHHHRVGAFSQHLGNQRIDRFRLVLEGQPLDPAGRDDLGGALQGQADHPDRDRALAGAEALDAVAGEQRGAVLLAHIGGEYRVCRTLVARFHRTRFAQGEFFAPAFAQALQFAPAAVELVIAHAGEIEVDAVHHPHGRLVEEQRGGQRAGADEIARADRHVVGVLLADLLDCGSEPRGTAGIDLLLPALPVFEQDRPLDRLEVAVKVVEADDTHRGRRGGSLGDRGAGGEHAYERQRDKFADHGPAECTGGVTASRPFCRASFGS